VIHRFHNYLPGWEIPANSKEYLTSGYGFITDYIAEAFHYSCKHVNRFAYAKNKVKLGDDVKGRDETAVLKTVSAFLKLLHPGCDPAPEELDEYVAYALEGRRRVKEQLHKRKPDGEFAELDFSFINVEGNAVRISCPESANVHFVRVDIPSEQKSMPPVVTATATEPSTSPGLQERHYTIRYGDIGHDFNTIFGDYIEGSTKVRIQDPYIRMSHQVWNFTRFCELAVRVGTVKEIELITGSDDETQEVDISSRLDDLADDLKDHGINFTYTFDRNIHDREVRFDHGWVVKVGRGFDIFQRTDKTRSGLGSQDLRLRPCLETSVDVFRE
jgi:ATP-dependent Lon protease